MLETMPEKLVNKGREEGREKTLQSVILKMLQKGHNISDIAEICGVTKEEILKVKNKQ